MVVAKLTEPGYLRLLAERAAEEAAEREQNGGPTIDELDQRIKAKAARLADLLAASYDPAAVDRAIEKINDDLTDLRQQRQELERWTVEREAQMKRVDALAQRRDAIADVLPDFTLEQQKAMLEELDVRVEITGYEDQRPGRPAVPRLVVRANLLKALDLGEAATPAMRR